MRFLRILGAYRARGQLYLLLPVEDVEQEDDPVLTLGCFDYGFQFPEATLCDNDAFPGLVYGLWFSVVKQCALVSQGIDNGIRHGGRFAIEVDNLTDAAGGADNSPVGFIAEVDKKIMGK